MPLPLPVVEVAFGTAPLTLPGTWTDVTAYVRSISIRRGRSHELGASQAGEVTIVLDNGDRRFDPLNASGPYYPNVLPMRQLRIRATHNAVTYPLFRGYVEEWDQTWKGRPRNAAGDAECVVHAVDGFKVLSLYQLRNTYPAEVLADDPLCYWRLDDPAGATIFEDSTLRDKHPMTVTGSGSTLGVTPGPVSGGATVLEVDGGTNTTVADADMGSELQVNPFYLYNPVVEFWVYVDAWTAQRIIVEFSDSATALESFSIVTTGVAGQLQWRQYSGAVYAHTLAAGTIPASTWTHVVAVHDIGIVDWYVNGTFAERTTSGAGAASFFGTNGWMRIGSRRSTSTAFDGKIAHVAVYDSQGGLAAGGGAAFPFSPARIAAHYAATFGLIGGGTAGTQITTLLDMLGWPAGLRSIDSSTTQMQAFDPVGSALGHLLRIAEASERGLFQIDAAGNAVFHSRDSLEDTTGSHGVSQATYGDGGGAEEPFADLELSYDDQDLWTRVIVTRDGGSPQLEEDATALAAYGPRTLDVSAGALANDGSAEAVSRFLLQSYRTPHVRPVAVKFTLANDVSLNAAVLGRDTHHDRVTVVRRPPGGGTITLDAHVEGITWDIAPAAMWEATLQLVPDNGVTIVAEGCDGGTVPVAAVAVTYSFSHAVTALTTGTTLVASGFGGAVSTPYYVFVQNVKGTTPDIPTLAGTNGWNVTWTQQGTWLSASGLRRVTLFTCTQLASSTAGNLTATFAGTQTGGTMFVNQASGANPTLAQAVQATGTGTALAASLTSPASTSMTAGFISSAATSGTWTAGTGYSPNTGVAVASGLNGVQRRTANDSVALFDGTASVSAAWQMIAIEVAAAVLGSPGSLPALNGVTESSSGTGARARPSAFTFAGHPGVVSLETGTTTTGRSALIGAADVLQLGALELFARSTVRTPSLTSDGTDTYTIRVGAGDSATGESTDFIGFRYTHSVNSGKWQAVCRSNSVETAVDTGVAFALLSWIDFGFIVNIAGTSVSFTMNGVAVGSAITTNIPTGSARKLTYLPAFILKSGTGTSNRILSLDRYAYVLGP